MNPIFCRFRAYVLSLCILGFTVLPIGYDVSASGTASPSEPTQHKNDVSCQTKLMWPVEGKISSSFGLRSGRFHFGIDISAPHGSPVSASAEGSVVFAGQLGHYGESVVIEHRSGLRTLYAHLHRSCVCVGADVGIGDIIGWIGTTGNATGPHLHFEVWITGKAVNPLTVLPKRQ